MPRQAKFKFLQPTTNRVIKQISALRVPLSERAYQPQTQKMRSIHWDAFLEFLAFHSHEIQEIDSLSYESIFLFAEWLVKKAGLSNCLNYVSTVVQRLQENSILPVNSLYNMTLTRIKSLQERSNVNKCRPILPSTFRLLGVLDKRVALFWLQTGLRMDSLLNIQQSDIFQLQSGVTSIWIKESKVLLPQDQQYIQIPSSFADTFFLPIPPSQVNRILKVLGTTSHSFRRTACLSLAVFIFSELRIHPSKVSGKVLKLINAHFLWKSQSKMFQEYTVDFHHMPSSIKEYIPVLLKENILKAIR